MLYADNHRRYGRGFGLSSARSEKKRRHSGTLHSVHTALLLIFAPINVFS
ncbi:hypothetical protein J27TS7_51040 [Paenibacillus dendritiformis]|nr:hypothetical protein J27TS7_51040 [Paenibacillus dendritiformis]